MSIDVQVSDLAHRPLVLKYDLCQLMLYNFVLLNSKNIQMYYSLVNFFSFLSRQKNESIANYVVARHNGRHC